MGLLFLQVFFDHYKSACGNLHNPILAILATEQFLRLNLKRQQKQNNRICHPTCQPTAKSGVHLVHIEALQHKQQLLAVGVQVCVKISHIHIKRVRWGVFFFAFYLIVISGTYNPVAN